MPEEYNFLLSVLGSKKVTMTRLGDIRRWPATKGMLFCLLPLAYYLAGVLNYSQAGKAALLGFFTLTMLFSWRDIFFHLKFLRLLLPISLVLLTASIVFQAALRQVFGVQQDDVMVVQAILNTNVEEAKGFFSQYLRYIIGHLLASSVFLAIYWRLFVSRPRCSEKNNRPNGGRARQIGAALLFTILVIAMHTNSSLRKANPLFYFFYHYSKADTEKAMAANLKKELASTGAMRILGGMHLDADIRQRIVVLVIGESDTRNNWSLYGYGRPTNPELMKLRDQLLVFQDVFAADGATVGAISKMLTEATVDEPDLWKSRPTIMAIARHLGYKVFWIANQGAADRGIVPILASQSDTTNFTNRGVDRGESSFDEVLFSPYQQALDDPAGKKLIIVQMLGAHPAYNYRYPEEYAIFEKLFDDRVAENLKLQGRAPWAILFRNMYDCAIRYEDHVLSQLLRRLMAKGLTSAAWLYVSDHGQDVVHNTDYSGHNIRARQQWEIPFVLWRSEGGMQGEAAAELAARPYRADVLDHTILGLLGVKGDYYDPEIDILSARFKPDRILPRRMQERDYD